MNNMELQNSIQSKLDNLTKPPGSLGRLEDIVKQFCLCRNNADASINKKTLFVFAGDHGIVEEKITPFPKEVTVQMVHNMLNCGSAVTVMCKKAVIDYRVVDMGVAGEFDKHPLLLDYKVAAGTKSFLKDFAMTPEQCNLALDSGKKIAASLNCDITAIGEMGIGNTSSASALFSLLLDKNAISTVGRGTGSAGEMLQKKQRVIAEAVSFHRKQWDNTPLDALQRVGGFELAGMTGFIIGCAQKHIPVVVDGFISTASALCAIKMQPDVKENLFFGHSSNEKFHKNVLQNLKVRPILDLDMRLGEGTGAVLAVQIIEQALNCYHNMATFNSAGVSDHVS
jgi:nicotinate-nucleotide--dimethylbenzimidazole phosphoribosyltransferase